MKEHKAVSELIGDIHKTLRLLEKQESFYLTFIKDREKLPPGKPYDLIVLADIFCDFYTCAETAFLRISKFFENHLDADRWHQHLLEKMTVDIPNVRKRVLEDSDFNLLLDFLKFRHFKRYYFEYEYDRERMDYLLRKFDVTTSATIVALKRYIGFLEELAV